MQPDRIGRIIFDLAPQAVDLDIDRPLTNIRLLANQLVARDRFACAQRKEQHDLLFAIGQPDRIAAALELLAHDREGVWPEHDLLDLRRLWLGVALLLAVFYRQTTELVWVIIPLLTLAALELSRAIYIFAEERIEVGVVVLALMILLVYLWFNVSKIALDPISNLASTTLPFFGRTIQLAGAPYMVLLGTFLIMILCVAFVAFGWSTRTAWLGTTWAFVIYLGIYSLAAAWGSSGLRAVNGVELWSSDQAPAQPELLVASVDEVSEFSLGHDQSQPVTIMGIDSPALEWVLRDRSVEMVSTLNPQVAPPIVITPIMDGLGLPAAYRGQDFTWRQRPLWEQIQNPEWIRWLVFRQLPRENETIILWVRDDLFPDAREASQQP